MKLIEKIRYQVAIKAVADLLNIEDGMMGFKCPFHNDITGTMMLKETENRFTCSGCGKSGSSVDLVKQVKNLNTDDAVNWLAEKFDIEEDSDYMENTLDAWKTDAASTMPSLESVFGIDTSGKTEVSDVELYRYIYHQAELNETARAFLSFKGFSDELIELLGFRVIGSPHLFFENMIDQYSKDDLSRSGLLDRNREFRFLKHTLLIPFLSDDEPEFLVGWRMSGGKGEFAFPQRKHRPVFFPEIHREKEYVFIVEDLRGVFAFLKRGYSAILVSDDLENNTLEKIRGMKISVCGEKNEEGSKFNRGIIRTLTEYGLDFSVREFSPVFEDYGDYLVEKKK